jgi:hypothetical protein
MRCGTGPRSGALLRAVPAGTVHGLDAGQGEIDAGQELLAVVVFAQAMFPRAAEAAGAEDIYDLMLGDDAPRSWVAMMNGAGQASQEPACAGG